MGVFRLYDGFLRVVQDYFKSVFDVILEYVTGVPRVILRCFCPIEVAWVAAMTFLYKIKPVLIKTSINTLEAQCGNI